LKRDLTERGRDVDSVEAQYYETVRPMHHLHVVPSRRFAHLIVPEGGENAPALEVIASRLLQFIGPGAGPPVS
jgi:uridine kinase